MLGRNLVFSNQIMKKLTSLLNHLKTTHTYKKKLKKKHLAKLRCFTTLIQVLFSVVFYQVVYVLGTLTLLLSVVFATGMSSCFIVTSCSQVGDILQYDLAKL